MSFLLMNGVVPRNLNPSPWTASAGGSAMLSQMILGRLLGFADHAVSLYADRSSATVVTASTS